MFHSARLKLTLWYLIIIMAISIAFSMFIYFGATRELNRVLRIQRLRIEHPEIHLQILNGIPSIESYTPLLEPDPEVIQEAKLRVLTSLLSVNIFIFLLSSLAGYFLAGRTLKPIQEMVEEQNRFIADASHELNTPLTSLRTAIEVTMRDKNLTVPKSRENLASNLEEVVNLQNLSDELIRVHQFDEPKDNYQTSPLLVARILKKAIEKLKAQAEKKQITIQMHLQDFTITGNEKSLIDLFVILLDNAIKYSKEKTAIKLQSRKTADHGIIEVIDEGMGIASEDIPYIFDRFYRADKSRTKKNIDGYGLGLSIAKKIINLHNGSIKATSHTGKGSTFTVILPI